MRSCREGCEVTKHDSKLYPGELFFERRERPDGKWELYSRDNDGDVMRTRFDYWKEPGNLKPGQSIRLFAPDCTLLEEYPAPEVTTP